MKITVIDESEDLISEIESYIEAGVVRHRIQFMTWWEKELRDNRNQADYDDEGKNYDAD